MRIFKDSHHFSRTLDDVWGQSLQYYSVPQSTRFYYSFEHPARRKWRKGRSATLKVCILPQFWTSNTHKVTRGLQWSAEEFAFYHSFERPTRPKWRKGCSATSKICILPQFWTSDTSEVTKGSLGQVHEFAFYHSFERPTRPKWRKGRAAT